NDAIEYLKNDTLALNAFRFANEVMRLQRSWTDSDPLRWRPFQLGFVLLALESVGVRKHTDRKVMDLLWFPTGGGKTEAYLLLTVFAMTIRRVTSGTEGNGIAVLMRYTLRLLTIQQFQRAAVMVLACELLRKKGVSQSRFGLNLGSQPFSIGLWVGGSTTPNKCSDVLPNPSMGQPDHRQLKECPCCAKPITWRTRTDGYCAAPYCLNSSCAVGQNLSPLPVWTVDEDIYREQPSLLISTADKFAQIVRNEDTTSLFGLRSGGNQTLPPDLIIQDELHLISGPLGSMAGLYECAIDEICARKGWRPKVIGSTATIRRATEQVKQLFWRAAFQFPPPVLDRINSCFAVQDADAPGRLYVGLSTAGRSAKFTLQAVCASLMQATQGLKGDTDPYTTLVAYFNSLRELGGALVMMHDDVPRSIEAYSIRKKEIPRAIKRVGELTSRVSATEIPDILKDLMLSQDKDGHYDVALASNMISVGVDVPRLGLMVVNGQPKNFSEYIQATSRVGRGKVSGLIVGIYNASRNRDRSHYETFRTWHSTLYRAVEATSVTPFAPRAQDKALHAVVVALARHLNPNLLKSPVLSQTTANQITQLAQRIVDRVKDIDPEESADVESRITDFINDWLQRSVDLRWYWNDRAYKRSLLISAEVVAALRAAQKGKPRAVGTPNSLRDVEPTSQYILLSRKPGGGVNAN
ncbi:MAG: helicase-related protein, partial [Bryobacteraceae bacterium]